MKRAVVRGIADSAGCVLRPAKGCIAAGLLLAAGAGMAAEPVDWSSDTARFTPMPLAATAAGGPAPGSVIEISSSNLPRFDPIDGTLRTRQRIDMALLSPGRSSFGVTMGLSGLSPSPPGLAARTPDGLTGVNLGLQWRYVLDSNRRIDITAWRDLGRPNDALAMIHSREAGYGARVEMQIQGGSSSPFVADRGFIGVQLDGGARITVRRSHGRPMVYYRNKF